MRTGGSTAAPAPRPPEWPRASGTPSRTPSARRSIGPRRSAVGWCSHRRIDSTLMAIATPSYASGLTVARPILPRRSPGPCKPRRKGSTGCWSVGTSSGKTRPPAHCEGRSQAYTSSLPWRMREREWRMEKTRSQTNRMGRKSLAIKKLRAIPRNSARPGRRAPPGETVADHSLTPGLTLEEGEADNMSLMENPAQAPAKWETTPEDRHEGGPNMSSTPRRARKGSPP